MKKRYNANTTVRRDGYPLMTGAQINVLMHLHECAESGVIWSTKRINPRIVKKLSKLGAIFESVDPHGHAPTAYKILPEGVKMLEAFGAEKRRLDNICPCCKTRPRRTHANGQQAVYCHPCEKEKYRQHSMRRLKQHTDRPCVECGDKPRAVTEYGWQYARCEECQRAYAKEASKRHQQRQRERVEAGEVIMCRCGKAPVHVTRSKVEQYCLTCLNRYSYTHKMRKRLPSKQRGSEAAD